MEVSLIDIIMFRLEDIIVDFCKNLRKYTVCYGISDFNESNNGSFLYYPKCNFFGIRNIAMSENVLQIFLHNNYIYFSKDGIVCDKLNIISFSEELFFNKIKNHINK